MASYSANNNDPPAITLTTTTSNSGPRSSTVTSGPLTYSTTVSSVISPRRHRNTNATDSTRSSGLVAPSTERLEPFPSLPGATPGTSQAQNDNYFPQTPIQYQVRQRPIGIRRITSSNSVAQTAAAAASGSARPTSSGASGANLTRRRTNTAPSRHEPTIPENATANLAGLPGHYEVGAGPGGMERIVEGQEAHHGELAVPEAAELETRPARSGSNRLRRLSNAARSTISKLSDDPDEDRLRRGDRSHDYESEVVDYLDVLDPEVSTLTTLTNIQNSLFVPDIPYLNRFYNRRPTYELSRPPSRMSQAPADTTEGAPLQPTFSQQISRKPVPPTPEPPELPPKTYDQEQRVLERGDSRTPEPSQTLDDEQLNRRMSITSHIEDNHFAVLPHGVELEGWTQYDIDELDDYVRHMLHSRRSRFKRSMKAFGKYMSKPLGFFVTLYAFLITAFGLIWVLFLIGWISVGDRKNYIVNVIDNVLVALFAIMGDGLAPFRAIDTYHMIYIAHYHRLSWRIRKQRALPKLQDHNDLPERPEKEVAAELGSTEKAAEQDWEYSVLSPEQQKKLVHHQNKFSRSHSYYRPHETTTHHAFPLKLLIAIVSLNDAHSMFQIMLGSFTWGWSYHTRPEWITSVILSLSITVNILGGILISVGDKKTRKKEVLMRMARQGLTEEAMRKVEKHKQEREEEVRPSGDDSDSGPSKTPPRKSFEKLRKSLDVNRATSAEQSQGRYTISHQDSNGRGNDSDGSFRTPPGE